MPSFLPHRRLIALAAFCFALAALVTYAADPNPTTGKRTDWATIDELLAAGDYANAAVAATNEITKDDRPKRWEPDFLPRSIESIRLLMRRGVAELRLGRLDAADATLEEADRLFTDEDLKRLLGNEARRASPRTISTFAMIDVDRVELLYLRMAVLLERMRFANLGIDAASTGEAGERGDKVARWGDEIDVLERVASKARKDLAERLERSDPALLSSPYHQSLVGRFRPALVAGIKSLEIGIFESGKTQAAGDADGGLTVEAQARFKEAATALDAAFSAAAPGGLDTMKRDARLEASLMQADLLTCEGRAFLEAGEPGAARERFAKAVELRQEVAALRRVKQSEKHPDLFVPLLLSAETLLHEARSALEAGDASRSRDRILEASKVLDRADSLAFPQDHPLRAWQRSLRARDVDDLATVKAAIPESDIADAAARRVRRAVDGTSMTGAATAP